jgi:penicillin-insensitive murein endopeptidase
VCAHAQDPGTLHPKPLPALKNPKDPKLPAKELFGRTSTPAQQSSQALGFYSRGCLPGAQALPINGDAWQVMRLSRNRNWGHPALIAVLETLGRKVQSQNIWPGLLVGDMSQPRGGPMITGHASHQIGLDADVWFSPMPDRVLSPAEREELSATNVVRSDLRDIDPAIWTEAHQNLLKAAATEKEVERIFVNPAIKVALCRDVSGDRSWLSKIRPIYGHNYHFHIRIACPPGEASCVKQDRPPENDGCDATLAWWFTEEALHPKPDPKAKPPQPLTMAGLPKACQAVLDRE